MTRIKDALDAVAAAIIAQKDYLTDLDRQIADGDHGINMARGFQAALDAVEEMDDTTKPGPVLYTARLLPASRNAAMQKRAIRPCSTR